MVFKIMLLNLRTADKPYKCIKKLLQIFPKSAFALQTWYGNSPGMASSPLTILKPTLSGSTTEVSLSLEDLELQQLTTEREMSIKCHFESLIK